MPVGAIGPLSGTSSGVAAIFCEGRQVDPQREDFLAHFTLTFDGGDHRTFHLDPTEHAARHTPPRGPPVEPEAAGG